MVFYGSQTGTGEEFAGRLAKEGVRYRLKGMVADPEECDMVSENFTARFPTEIRSYWVLMEKIAIYVNG